jgi:hypothetical protein
MGYNTIVYADVPQERMSAATSFYTTMQQLCLTVGIGVSAAALATSMAWRGHAQALPIDFSSAYVFVASVALFAPLVATTLHPMAGSELSGQREPAKRTGPRRPVKV